jgi:hypothetical protein
VFAIISDSRYSVKRSAEKHQEKSKMLTVEQVKDALHDRKLRVVAEETGLSYDTVWRVSTGNNVRVSYDVIKRLSDYLTASVASNG